MTALAAGSLRLRKVGKRFTKYEDTPTLAYGVMRAWGRSRRSQLWAVRDVDLDISPGEAVGIIGANGSGKSTLLQMLCGVTAPTEGELRVAGRIAPLISVGVGFHPELTGRENVYVNGTILGLKRRQIDRRLEEIVAFSGIEDFIDTPVKFYSSGMFVRLGFSVAAHVEPDVLLVDEVLAVGDFAFQMKCAKHMQRLREQGTTTILVSHNSAAIEQSCNRAMVMNHGRMVFQGSAEEAISSYHGLLGDDVPVEEGGALPREAGVLNVLSMEMMDAGGQPTSRYSTGDLMRVRISVQASQPVNAPFVSVELLSKDGMTVYREHNLFRPYAPLDVGGPHVLEAALRLPLTTGSYSLSIVLGRGNPASREPVQLASDVAQLAPERRLALYVQGRRSAHGLVDLDAIFSPAELA